MPELTTAWAVVIAMRRRGARFGVIPVNRVDYWYECAEYPPPPPIERECEHCGTLVTDESAVFCECGEELSDINDCVPEMYDDDTMLVYEREGYAAYNDGDGDIWVTRSPFYTFAQFCSPCAPGACYLLSPLSTVHGECSFPDNKCYCLGPDFFDGGAPPYPVWRVDTRELVYPV